jgi:2-polyprenyl-3-methyl-5-hydroxy-6-metoxy-1,4-benzoquinol methylase
MVTDDPTGRDAFAEQLFSAVLGFFGVLAINLGFRLGLYRVLSDGAPVTAGELAARAGIAERYAREWLEQQATTGILRVDLGEDPPRFSLPAPHAEVLLDQDSLSFMGASVQQVMSLPEAFDHVAEAFRTGGGVPYEIYGAINVDGQGGANRPVLLSTLPNEWLPEIPSVHERLSSDPGARVLDVGCGVGWSSIAIASAYPHVLVDGVDPDEMSVERARTNAEAAGLTGRVRFHKADAATLPTGGPVDFATAFECIHDMAQPVEVLRSVLGVLNDDGAMLVVDERTRDAFTGEPDALESYFYGWSLFECLPAGMVDRPSAETGTVMRPDTLRRYATEAGFGGFEILPIAHDAFRLYLLRP